MFDYSKILIFSTRFLCNLKQLLILLAGLNCGLITANVANGATLDSDVQFLNIDSSNSLMYWIETGPLVIKIQRSTDGGTTWLNAVPIASAVPGFVIADFDGIYPIGAGGRLIASFAAFNLLSGSVHLAVRVSDDFGASWGNPVLVLSQAGASFVGCPSLTTSYNPASNTVSLHTTLSTGPGQASIFYVSSSDGGTTWNSQKQLADIPETCTDV